MNVRKQLRSISHALSNCAYRAKRRKKESVSLTLQQILDLCKIDCSDFSDDIASKLNVVVSYVCRWGDRFTKNCICVQLYDDSDRLMRLAMEKGALVCVTDHPIEGVPCIVVEQPAVVYADMCRLFRNEAKTRAAVIVGSIGKTTTKKMVDAVFGKAYYTMCDCGNDNILDSVGSICQHLPHKAEWYIAEMSEDTPGLIEQMCKIAQPQIAIITSIDKSHIEFYGSQERIFDEFRSVTKHMTNDGVCIVSLDEPNARQLITDKKVVFISTNNKDADYYATNIEIDEAGLRFSVHEKSTDRTFPVRLVHSFAKHNVTSALYAFAAGVLANIPYDTIIRGLLSYRATGIRQNVYRAGKTVVYADCYNAVARSIRSAVQAAETIPVSGKRIAVLGDVAEAGDYTESTHAEIVDIINRSDFDVLLTCGEQLKAAIRKNGLREGLKCHTFESQKEMNRMIKRVVRSKDLILFKASHSGHLDRSIANAFPFAYFYQAVRYYTPRLLWHFKVILH